MAARSKVITVWLPRLVVLAAIAAGALTALAAWPLGSSSWLVIIFVTAFAVAIGAMGVALLLMMVLREHHKTQTALTKYAKTSKRIETALHGKNGLDQLSSAFAVLVRLKSPLDAGLVTRPMFETAMSKQGLEIAKARRELAAAASQLEAYTQLINLVQPAGPLPASRGWAASPDYLLHLVKVISADKPRVIVDLGSGLSTLTMASALKAMKIDGRVVAVDHDAEFAAKTRVQVEALGLSDIVDVRHAPLVDNDVPGAQAAWYDLAVFNDLKDIDLLSVDGPPGTVGPQSRFPALPVLHTKLSPHVVIVMDDAAREDETAIAHAWAEQYPEFTMTVLPFEKGAVELRRG